MPLDDNDKPVITARLCEPCANKFRVTRLGTVKCARASCYSQAMVRRGGVGRPPSAASGRAAT